MSKLSFLFENYGTQFFLGLVILLGLGFYVGAFDGYYFYDDLKYMEYAYQIAHHQFQLTSDNFCHRFGLIVPTTLGYAVFGVNEWTSTWWVLVCWAASVWLCYKIVHQNTLSCIASTILCGLDYRILKKPILPRQFGKVTIGVSGAEQNNVIQSFTLKC
jgi:hypothetical protein